MPTYYYGSVPTNPDAFRAFVRFLAPHLPSEDEVFKCDGSLRWRHDLDFVTREFFRCLCYWKSPRRKAEVNRNTTESIRRVLKEALGGLGEDKSEGSVRSAINHLCSLYGVEVRTASVILTAWNPDEYGIYDFKVHEVLVPFSVSQFRVSSLLMQHVA